MVARLKDNIDTQYHTCHCWFSSVQKYTVSYNSLIVNVVRIHTTTTCSGHVFFHPTWRQPFANHSRKARRQEKCGQKIQLDYN